jgi:diguanylate cyclase (GGDEF)-like protein
VAELIQASTRTDDIACRFGGDEFTLIMPETTLESAWQCAERLRESATRLQLHYNQKPLGSLTLSIGVAVFPKHGETGALALRAADEAMYQAKQAGKNRVMVSSR